MEHYVRNARILEIFEKHHCTGYTFKKPETVLIISRE